MVRLHTMDASFTMTRNSRISCTENGALNFPFRTCSHSIVGAGLEEKGELPAQWTIPVRFNEGRAKRRAKEKFGRDCPRLDLNQGIFAFDFPVWSTSATRYHCATRA